METHWWMNSPCHQQVLDLAIDTRTSLVPANPVVCTYGHAIEIAAARLYDDWTCPYPGCKGEVTAQKVNDSLKTYLLSVIDQLDLGYKADELEEKTAEKIERMRLKYEIDKRVGKFILQTADAAPPPGALIAAREVRNVAYQEALRPQRNLKKELLVAITISAFCYIYFEIYLPFEDARRQNSDSFFDDTCPA